MGMHKLHFCKKSAFQLTPHLIQFTAKNNQLYKNPSTTKFKLIIHRAPERFILVLDSVWMDKIERPIRVETTVNFSLQELNSSLQSSAGESEWWVHLLWPQGRYTYTTGTFARPEDLAHAYFPFCQKSAFQFTQFSLQPKISNYIKIRSQQIFIWPLIEL